LKFQSFLIKTTLAPKQYSVIQS